MLGYGIKETTTSTGATLTLSAASGFPRYSDVFIDGQPCLYSILDSIGQPVENGIGHYAATNTIVREYAYQKYVSGTLTQPVGTPSTLAAGTYTVFPTLLDQHFGVPPVPSIHASAANRAMWPYPYMGGQSSPTIAVLANTPYVICGYIGIAAALNSLGTYVTTLGGTVADRIQVGVYPVMFDATPGNLICRSGDMRPNTTGAKSSSIVGAPKLVPPGWYYLAVMTSVNCTLFANNYSNGNGQVTALGINSNAWLENVYCLGSAVSAGWTAMPSTLGTLASFAGGVFSPYILVYV